MKSVGSMFLLTMVLATTMAPLSAQTEPLHEKLAAFKAAIRAETPLAKASTPATPGMPVSPLANPKYVVSELDSLLAGAENPSSGANVESEISQIMTIFPSERVQKAGQELLTEMSRNRGSREKAAAEQIQSLLARVQDEVNKAQKPEDLDSLIGALQKQVQGSEGGYSYGAENARLVQEASTAFEFTKLWQMYLSHKNTGQANAAKNDLQNLSQNNFAFGIMPRSKILALLAADDGTASVSAAVVVPQKQEAEILKLINSMNSLDDMEHVWEQLNDLVPTYSWAQGYRDRLTPMLQIYSDLKAGMATSVNVDFSEGPNGPGASAKINQLLLKFVLAHYFEKYHGPAPDPAEKPAAFVERVKADALERQDWELLKKAVTAHAYLFRNLSGASVDEETVGLDNLLDGLNQEKAGQFPLAVISYQKALKAGSLDVPAKFIGERLADLQKNHPGEFAQAMEIFLVLPPLRTYPGISPLMSEMTSGGMNGRYGPYGPGYPPIPQPARRPTLEIPAATGSSPANSATPDLGKQR